MKIVKLFSTTSTQDEIEKYLGENEDVAVVSKIQTGGKGTKGRSFDSQEGGLYVTFFIRSGGAASKAYEIVQNFSVAVAKTLIGFGADAKIKWPNDVFVGGKKICGMLTRNKISDGVIEYSVVGIGINVNNDLSDEIKDIAVSLKDVVGRKVDVDEVFSRLIENIYVKWGEREYAALSCVLGKRVLVCSKEEKYYATAEKVLPDGRLLLDNGRAISDEEIKISV